MERHGRGRRGARAGRAGRRARDAADRRCRRGRNGAKGLRRAAVVAFGRVGALVEEERTRVVDELEELLDDSGFLVHSSAIAAAESLGDARLLAGTRPISLRSGRRPHAPRCDGSGDANSKGGKKFRRKSRGCARTSMSYVKTSVSYRRRSKRSRVRKRRRLRLSSRSSRSRRWRAWLWNDGQAAGPADASPRLRRLRPRASPARRLPAPHGRTRSASRWRRRCTMPSRRRSLARIELEPRRPRCRRSARLSTIARARGHAGVGAEADRRGKRARRARAALSLSHDLPLRATPTGGRSTATCGSSARAIRRCRVVRSSQRRRDALACGLRRIDGRSSSMQPR